MEWSCQDDKIAFILLKEITTRKVGKYEQPPCSSDTLTKNKVITSSKKHPRTVSISVSSHGDCVSWTYADGNHSRCACGVVKEGPILRTCPGTHLQLKSGVPKSKLTGVAAQRSGASPPKQPTPRLFASKSDAAHGVRHIQTSAYPGSYIHDIRRFTDSTNSQRLTLRRPPAYSLEYLSPQ